MVKNPQNTDVPSGSGSENHEAIDHQNEPAGPAASTIPLAHRSPPPGYLAGPYSEPW